MEFPDDVLRHIKGFLGRPKLKTPMEWADFYLSKTEPLRYKVGMTFIDGDRSYTILEITSTYIITTYGIRKFLLGKRIGTYFEYNGFEWCEDLPWNKLIQSDRINYLVRFLRFKHVEAMLKLVRNPYIRFKHDRLLTQFMDDYKMGYAKWGAVVNNKIETTFT